MYKTIINAASLILLMLFILSVCNNTFAQDAGQAQSKGEAKTIFDFKAELKLTDEQEQKIKTILTNLNKDVQVKRARLVILNSEIEELLKKEGDLAEIKKKLDEFYSIQSFIKCADIEASRNINKSLTLVQLNKWREIQAVEKKK